MCHSRGDCANCIHLHRISGGPATQFFWEASRASPQHGWQSAYRGRSITPPQIHAGGGVGRQQQLTIYYVSNSLRANPDKTQVTSFHLKNLEAKRTLEFKWNNTDLENTTHLKYLGVTLDTVSYKQQIHNTKMKVATRNNLLKKLSNSKWGCNASTIITTALALPYSAAEYACPVWARSLHAWILN